MSKKEVTSKHLENFGLNPVQRGTDLTDFGLFCIFLKKFYKSHYVLQIKCI